VYNKLFTKILDSSIWLETNPTRIVWMTLIASMDEDGFSQYAALGNLAGRARVTLEEAKAAVDCLEGPDRESGDPENEGRRIERVPGGWMVLNAEKYRSMVTRVVIQDQTRARVARFRAKKRSVTQGNASVTVCNEVKRQSNDVLLVSDLAFDSDAFRGAWGDFVRHRTEIRKPLKPTSAKLCMEELKAMGESRAIAALKHTTARGWQGLKEPDIAPAQPAPKSKRPQSEIDAEQARLATHFPKP
jgi:hypothetical protein